MQFLAAAEPWLWGITVTVVIVVALIWIRKDQKRQIRRALQNTESSLKEHTQEDIEFVKVSSLYDWFDSHCVRG